MSCYFSTRKQVRVSSTLRKRVFKESNCVVQSKRSTVHTHPSLQSTLVRDALSELLAEIDRCYWKCVSRSQKKRKVVFALHKDQMLYWFWVKYMSIFFSKRLLFQNFIIKHCRTRAWCLIYGGAEHRRGLFVQTVNTIVCEESFYCRELLQNSLSIKKKKAVTGKASKVSKRWCQTISTKERNIFFPTKFSYGCSIFDWLWEISPNLAFTERYGP